MSAVTDYLAAVRAVLAHLETTQLERVEQAAGLVVEALRGGHAIHCSGIGHGNEGDFINRAGGLAAVLPFSWSFTVNDPVAEPLKGRPGSPDFDRECATVRLAVQAGNLRSGDVMLVSSVSGRNKGPIELSLACRERGLKVIAFTAFRYAAEVESNHPSGKKLAEVADVAVDIGAPFGDAAVSIPGYEFKLMPVSGVAATVAGWLIWGRVMERMAAEGAPATVFMSANRPGGGDYYQAALKEFHRKGY